MLNTKQWHEVSEVDGIHKTGELVLIIIIIIIIITTTTTTTTHL